MGRLRRGGGRRVWGRIEGMRGARFGREFWWIGGVARIRLQTRGRRGSRSLRVGASLVGWLLGAKAILRYLWWKVQCGLGQRKLADRLLYASLMAGDYGSLGDISHARTGLSTSERHLLVPRRRCRRSWGLGVRFKYFGGFCQALAVMWVAIGSCAAAFSCALNDFTEGSDGGVWVFARVER